MVPNPVPASHPSRQTTRIGQHGTLPEPWTRRWPQAGHSIDPARWQTALDELLGRIAGQLTRVEPRRRARAFVCGLLADLPRKNCWTISPAPCARGDLASHPTIAMRTESNLGIGRSLRNTSRAPERDRALRAHRKWRDTSSGWLIVRRLSSRASSKFGLERLGHWTAAAEAGGNSGERRHHEHGC
jgi:hypothetical protein